MTNMLSSSSKEGIEREYGRKSVTYLWCPYRYRMHVESSNGYLYTYLQVWSNNHHDCLLLSISVWLMIVMNMLLLLCYAPLIYLSLFSPMFVCCGVCAPLEYKKLGRVAAAWARGHHWLLFSYLSFKSLVESLWYATLGTYYFIFRCYMSYSL